MNKVTKLVAAVGLAIAVCLSATGCDDHHHHDTKTVKVKPTKKGKK